MVFSRIKSNGKKPSPIPIHIKYLSKAFVVSNLKSFVRENPKPYIKTINTIKVVISIIV